MAKKSRKKPGPPARYGYRPTLTIRLQEPLYEAIKRAAERHGKSLSEEIEDTLEAAREVERDREEARQILREATAARRAHRVQALREAGFRLLRESDGTVNVVVPVELLHAEADIIQDERVRAEMEQARQQVRQATKAPQKNDDEAA
jgi:hypothetical protein